MFQMKISPVCPAAAKMENSDGWNVATVRHEGAES